MMAKAGRLLLFLWPMLVRADDLDLDAYITRQMAEGGIPSLSARVILGKNTTTWASAYGDRDVGTGEPATVDTLYTHASISKTVISFAVMMLEERGVLDLDADVGGYLGYSVRNPGFPDVPVSLRMLMSHVSSVSDDDYFRIYPEYAVEGDPTVAMGDFCEMLFTARAAQQFDPSHAPGTSYSYSNIGATLAACAAERAAIAARLLAADGTFDDLALGLVMAPLGVGAAGEAGYLYEDIDAAAWPIAMPSLAVGRARYVDRCLYGYPDYADGMWKASTASYAQLFATFVNNGTSPSGAALLRPATVAEMRREQYPGVPGAAGQGLVWYAEASVLGAGHADLLGHSGGDLGVATDAFFDPTTGAGFVVYTNGDWDCATCAFSRAMANIEARILRTFGPYGGATADASVARRRDGADPEHHPSRRVGKVGAALCSHV